MSVSLVSLLNRVYQGDPDAVTELITGYYPMMYKTALGILGNSSDAQDVVQDASIKLIRNIKQLDNVNSFEPWVKRIVRNEALDYMKTAYKSHNVMWTDMSSSTDEGELAYDPADERIDYQPELTLDEKTRQEIILEVLNTLPVDQRTVLQMYFYDGMKLQEIADELGVPMSTVTGRLQKAKTKVKASVTEIQRRDGIKLYGLTPLTFFLYLLGWWKGTGNISVPPTFVFPEAAQTSIRTAVTKSAEAVRPVQTAAEGIKAAGAKAAVKTAAAVGAKASVPLAVKIGLGAAVAAGAVFGGTQLMQKPKVNLDKYIMVSADGYNTYGELEYSFDTERFEEDYGKKIKLNEKSAEYEELKDRLEKDKLTPAELLVTDYVQLIPSKTDRLSNGDTVQMVWLCDSAVIEDAFDIDIKFSITEYKVDDLEQVDIIDPFQYVNVSFEGRDPEGKLVIDKDTSHPELNDIDFTTTQWGNLKNGDTVEVYAYITKSPDEFVDSYGFLIDTKSRSFTVSGLPRYAKEGDTIPDELLNELIAENTADFRNHVDTKWAAPGNLRNFDYVGYYLLTSKEDDHNTPRNYLYLIYYYTTTNPNSDQVIEMYCYASYENVGIDENGNVTVDKSTFKRSRERVYTGSMYSLYRYYYYGFETLRQLQYQVIAPKAEVYDLTTTIE